jgi:hypothetical protein
MGAWGWGRGEKRVDNIPSFCSEVCFFPKCPWLLKYSAASLPGPVHLALGLCTLQTTLLWFLSKVQQYLAVWTPGSFLILIQKDLPVSGWGVGRGGAWVGLNLHSLFPPKASTAWGGSSVQPGHRGKFSSGGGASAEPGDSEAVYTDAGENWASEWQFRILFCAILGQWIGRAKGTCQWLGISLASPPKLPFLVLLIFCSLLNFILWKNFKRMQIQQEEYNGPWCSHYHSSNNNQFIVNFISFI